MFLSFGGPNTLPVNQFGMSYECHLADIWIIKIIGSEMLSRNSFIIIQIEKSILKRELINGPKET